MAIGSAAHAQVQTADNLLYMPEGQTQQGDVSSPADGSRIVIDMAGNRLDHATGQVDLGATANSPALLTGDLYIYSTDTLWLRAEGETTASMFEGEAQLPDGSTFAHIGYDASGNGSVLTLTAPTAGGNSDMEQTVHLAGDGTVVIQGRINTSAIANTTAILVHEGSSSSILGQGGDGKIDLVLEGLINSSGLGFYNTVDARHADSVTVRSTSGISAASGTVLNAGDAEVAIEHGGQVRVQGTTNPISAGSVAIRTTNSIDNFGSINAVNHDNGSNLDASAIEALGASIINRRIGGQIGQITASGDAIVASGDTMIQNDGQIASLFGAAIAMRGIDSSILFRNGVQGLVEVGTHFRREGTSTTAYEGGEGTDIVVNAGTIEGDVLLGGGNDMFLIQGDASSVDGIIDGGSGSDAYGRSFTASQTHQLSNSILTATGLTGFEYHGVETIGADTSVTITADETLNAGIQMIGNGTVVNEANITTDEYGLWARAHDRIEGGLTIINRGNVTASSSAFYGYDFFGTVRNDGSLVSEGSEAVYLYRENDAEGDALDFENNGTISTDNAYHDTFYAFSQGGDFATSIVNNGSILKGGNGDFSSALFNYAIRAHSWEGTISLDNRGVIEAEGEGNSAAFIQGADITIDNSDTIRSTGSGGSGLTIDPRGAAASYTATLTNSGTISANGGGHVEGNGIGLAYALGINATAGDATISVANSGTIEATGSNSTAIFAHGNGDVTLEIVNTGTIRGAASNPVYAAGIVALETGVSLSGHWLGNGSSERTVASAIQTYGTIDDIENRGTIIGNVDLGDGNDRFANYSTVEGDVRLGLGDDEYVYGLGSTLTGTAFGGDGTDTLVIDMSGDQNGKIHADDYRQFERITRLAGTSGTGILSLAGAFDVASIEINGMSIQVDEGDTVSSQGGTVFSGGNGETNEEIVNRGTINGNIDLGAGNDTVDNWGVINGDIDLGAGDDRYIARAGSDVNGTIDGGAGDNTFIFQLGGGTIGEVPTNVTGFNSYGVYGPGTLDITLAAGQNYTNLELLDEANLEVDSTGGTVGNIIGDDSAQHVTVGENTLTGSVSLGGGDDTLDMTFSGVLTGALDGGAGNDTLNLTLTGAATINGMNGFETANVYGASPLTLGGALGAGQRINFDGSDNELIIAAGAVFEGTVNGGEGSDLLRIQSGASDSRTVVSSQIISFEELIAEGAGTLALTGGEYSFEEVTIDGGHLELGTDTVINADIVFTGAADNRFTLGANAAVDGIVDAGGGNDTMAFATVANDVRVVDMTNFLNFENMAVSGAGEVRLGDYAFSGNIELDGHLTITGDASAAGGIIGGAGDDNLVVLGTFEGDVDLGAGDDRLGISSFDAITGMVDAGEGSNTLAIYAASTYETPLEFDGTGFDGFQNFEVASGVVSLTADTSWTSLDVTGGHLIGQADTVLTVAEGINVAHGATFGSAGIVNADITVAGTLSPGASPGTMTVNGDVSFLAGSNLLLELTPEATDLLNISGVMTIAEGAAIDITGVLNGVPGNMLDLVVAEGGIEGRFTTINKSDTVFGFVVQNGNRLQLQSEFQNDDAFPTNVQASVDYSNLVLRSGYGVQAYTAALNVLTDAEGNIDQRAFAQLTPEAYGSAMQAGVDTALNVADSTRVLVATTPSRPGWFGFAQGLIGGSDIAGQAATGSADADLRSTGFFGGVGYGFAAGTQVGAFIGKATTDQALRRLGAETETDGFVAGAYADASFGGLGIHALVAYHGGDADTTRAILAAPAAAKAKYGLDSWVADVTARYAMDIGDGWAVAPKVGVTYVNTKRDDVVEEGAGDFALSVDGNRHTAWFADASISASAALPAGGLGIRPYVEVGVRQMMTDGDVVVTGGYTGATAAPIVVAGTVRDKTVGRVGLGFGLDLTESVRFQAGYTGEFSSTDRHNFTGGMSIRF